MTHESETALSGTHPESQVLKPCKRCKGTGTVADYVGDDMRCIEVECDLCAGKQP